MLPENLRAIQNYRLMQMTGTLLQGGGFGQEGMRTMILFREIEDQMATLRAQEGKRSGAKRK